MKALLTVALWRPTYNYILDHLAGANPGLKLDLALTNDTGKVLNIPESIACKFKKISIFNHPCDLFYYCPEFSGIPFIHRLFKLFRGPCLWENILLLYAFSKKYDAVIFWEDDQIPIWHGGDDFFSSQLRLLRDEEETHLCVSKRRGYLHRIPPYPHKYIPKEVLGILEDALRQCNEIVFPGLLTGSAECFVPDNASSPYGGIEFFGGRKFIYAGSSMINLHQAFPCFFDVPDLDNHNISRGNDVFLSLAYGRDVKLKEADNRYFHDPYLFSRQSDTFINCPREAVDFFDWKGFFSLINAWLSYGPLLLRLLFPSDWEKRIDEVKSLLKYLPFSWRQTHHIFCAFAARVHDAFDLYHDIQGSWSDLCNRIGSSR